MIAWEEFTWKYSWCLYCRMLQAKQLSLHCHMGSYGSECMVILRGCYGVCTGVWVQCQSGGVYSCQINAPSFFLFLLLSLLLRFLVTLFSNLLIEPSSLAWTLGSWVRIPLKAWIFVRVYSVFMLSCVGRGLATGWSLVQALPTV
jgi:hypothetical protein